jgi:hypothetical protein
MYSYLLESCWRGVGKSWLSRLAVDGGYFLWDVFLVGTYEEYMEYDIGLEDSFDTKLPTEIKLSYKCSSSKVRSNHPGVWTSLTLVAFRLPGFFTSSQASLYCLGVPIPAL